MGGPPNPKKFSIKKIVFYGQSESDAEKFADFNGTIIFEIRQKMAEISYKKDGYRQRNVRQFLQHNFANSRESRRYVVACTRFAGECNALGYLKIV